jgi:uncharacterized protein (TIGR00255 family)
MSGFGRGCTRLGDGQIIVEIKSVNHRFLEVRIRTPRELLASEPLIEKSVRQRLGRGHCTVHVVIEGVADGGSKINEQALKGHLKQLIKVADEVDLCLADLVPVLSGSPDLYASAIDLDREGLDRALESSLDEALTKLLEMREAEGRAMASEITARVDGVRQATAVLEQMAADQSSALLERARKRIATLLAGTDIKLDRSRIEAEAALLVDRADVTEEIARLKSHCTQTAVLLDHDDPVGRRVEFLLQEMGREANTLAAKLSAPEATYAAVELKAELEKIREIVQNVE